MNSLHDYSMVSLLPESLRKDPFIVALGEAVEKELKDAYREAESLSNFNGVDNLPEFLLDYLAYQKHVDYYDEKLPLDVKRSIVDNSLILHRLKGSPNSIERALLSVGVEAEVVEWFEYDAAPFHFMVEMAPNFSIVDRGKMNEMVLIYKNLRSWFDGFVIVVVGKDIFIIEDTYSYPVFYQACGEFNGEKEFTQFSIGQFGVIDDAYDYMFEYPVAEKEFTQFEVGSAGFMDDSYDYIKRFPVTGEMEPLSKSVATFTGGLGVSGEGYDFGVYYPICGEFYAEGDE